MIGDKKGRPWKLRFRRSRYGWTWDARWNSYGQGGGHNVPFATKELAVADAQQQISSSDAVAATKEFFRRLEEQQHEIRDLSARYRSLRGVQKEPTR